MFKAQNRVVDENEFEKSLGLETTEETCRRLFRMLRDDRAYWQETVPRFLSGDQTWNAETMAKLLTSMMRVENSVQFAIQHIYYKETGRLLDKVEADNPGLGDMSPGE